ncbi:hypothetical protein BPOR_0268g00060 [Botrytis porri]|uniref:Uncharacterized protein n=1 Tax=Botrytis porri TaxID=87229 RepID=A0A4Z1KQK9_9HELO|nr:hypothetical protein BPOR_0268g00060 [Botrytis porri]
MPGAKEASKAPRKNLAAIIPDQLYATVCNVADNAHPNTVMAPHICGGIIFHINTNGSNTIEEPFVAVRIEMQVIHHTSNFRISNVRTIKICKEIFRR